MPGQPSRNTARRWHYINIGIAIVLPCESDHRSVRRKVWVGFDACAGCQPLRLSTFAPDDPQVTGEYEGDGGLTDSRALKQKGFSGLCQSGDGSCEEKQNE